MIMLARWWRRVAPLALTAVLFVACGSAPSTALGPAPATGGAGTGEIFAALGASETAGFGIDDQPLRLRAAWPQLFFNEALSRASTYYNYAVPGITLAEADSVERPAALIVRPTVVTIFFGANDILQGVTPDAFEADLSAMVHTMRQSGSATVLVANVPPLDHLPGVLACLPGAPSQPECTLGRQVPSIAGLDAVVSAYDGVIARVAGNDGAKLVDLHGQGGVLQANPAYVSSDGFHPSPLGHAAIARLFVDTYRARPPATA